MSRLYALCFATLIAMGSLLAPQTAQAAESYDNCTGFITTLPAVITTQGTWCMNQDLVTQITAGNAIEIATNNVIIDCNDFKLGNGSNNPSTYATGIYAGDRLNTVVRNCNIRRFYIGILIVGAASGGHIVEDNRLDGNTYIGLWLQGDGSVIRRNRVFDTGGSANIAYAYGINANNSVDIIDNTITNVIATTGGNGTVYGMNVQNNGNGRILDNAIRGLLKDGSGWSFGMYVPTDGSLVMSGNHILGTADADSYGIYCPMAGKNTVKDNIIVGFVTALTNNCNNDGNLIKP